MGASDLRGCVPCAPSARIVPSQPRGHREAVAMSCTRQRHVRTHGHATPNYGRGMYCGRLLMPYCTCQVLPRAS